MGVDGWRGANAGALGSVGIVGSEGLAPFARGLTCYGP